MPEQTNYIDYQGDRFDIITWRRGAFKATAWRRGPMSEQEADDYQLQPGWAAIKVKTRVYPGLLPASEVRPPAKT